MGKDEFIDFVYTMHLQNTNGRESTNEMFRLGIEVAYDEMNKICPKEVNLKFTSIEELAKHIQMNMPLAIRPTKKAKTVFVNPFISGKAREICIDAIVKNLMKQKR
jgi:hypothetical protein